MTSGKKNLLFFLSFILIASACFQLEASSFIMRIFSLGSKLVFLLSFLWAVKHITDKKFRYLFLLVVFMIFLIYTTMRNSFDIVRIIPIFMKVMGVVLLMTPYMVRYNREVINILAKVYTIIIGLNFLQMIIFPSAFGDGYLIANNYNQFGSIIIATVLLAYLDYKYTRKKLTMYFRFFISVATVAIPGSLTSTMAMIMLILYFLLVKSVKLRKLGIYSLFLFVILFFSLFVVGQSVIYYNPKFTELMDMVGKDVTFSGRTPMWMNTLLRIAYSPIFGHGFYTNDWALFNIRGVNSHNIILNLFLQGGVILFALFLIVVIYVIRQVNKAGDRVNKLELLFSFMVFMLMSQLEVYHYSMIFLFFFVLIIGSYYNKPIITRRDEYIDNSSRSSD